MNIAILTSGILPVPAVQGGAVETLIDHYLEYNQRHRLHDITVYSVGHAAVASRPQPASSVVHYRYIDVSSWRARVRRRLHGLLHRHTYYHYSIDYFFQQALREMRREDFDLIILENRPGYALYLRGKTRTPLVYHLHNDFLNSETPHASELYLSAARIVTVSDYIRRRVCTCDEHDQKTVTVYNGIDLEAFARPTMLTREQIGCRADDFILAFSGRLIPEKGIMQLAQAMRLLGDLPRIRLMIMGSAFYGNDHRDNDFIRALRQTASELGDRIFFTGYVGHDQVPDYLKLADVAVVPSTWAEPFGLTVVEGMAAGLPVITTDRGGIPEMLTADRPTATDGNWQGQNAIVVSVAGDLTAQLAEAIRCLYHDKELRQRMGEASLRLSRKYSKENYARAFFEAIS